MTTQTLTLAGFLLARLDEDAEVARRAPDVYACWNGSETDQDLSSVADIAPGRLLAECEAKRRIVEACQANDRWTMPNDRADQLAEDVLSFLALAYASHPDYRSEWAP